WATASPNISTRRTRPSSIRGACCTPCISRARRRNPRPPSWSRAIWTWWRCTRPASPPPWRRSARRSPRSSWPRPGAARRAALRALPLLEPGRSLRLVLLPAGQDPDELLRSPAGRDGFQSLLDAAVSLADHLWRAELEAGPLDTPERRAAFRARLRELVRSIAHKDVRDFYGQDFLERQRRLFAPAEPRGRSAGPRRAAFRNGGRGRRRGWEEPVFLKTGPDFARVAGQRNERVAVKGLLAALLNHPALIEDYHEALAGLSLAERDLDLLRTAIVNISAGYPGLDATAF